MKIKNVFYFTSFISHVSLSHTHSGMCDEDRGRPIFFGMVLLEIQSQVAFLTLSWQETRVCETTCDMFISQASGSRAGNVFFPGVCCLNLLYFQSCERPRALSLGNRLQLNTETWNRMLILKRVRCTKKDSGFSQKIPKFLWIKMFLHDWKSHPPLALASNI